MLRKDFIVDRYQIVEARAAGADAILLIVAALGDDDAGGAARHGPRDCGLDVLVEAHDEDEVARAVAAGAEIIGINNRDLRTFTVDRELAVRLRPSIPADRIVVAESGIRDAADVARLRDARRRRDPGRRDADARPRSGGGAARAAGGVGRWRASSSRSAA